MNIQLPNRFELREKGELIAWVMKEGKNKILKIRPQYGSKDNQFINFRLIMTELTYELKGRNICSYCGQEFNTDDMTVDHLYPFSLGGPTIPENLVPTCKKCNQTKSYLTAEEYFKFKMLPINERENFKKQMKNEHEEILRKGLCITPKDFFTEEHIGHIIVPMNMSDPFHNTNYNTIANHYKIYKQYKYPIALDRKNYLLDGFYVVVLAKKNKDINLLANKLENVDVVLD